MLVALQLSPNGALIVAILIIAFLVWALRSRSSIWARHAWRHAGVESGTGDLITRACWARH